MNTFIWIHGPRTKLSVCQPSVGKKLGLEIEGCRNPGFVMKLVLFHACRMTPRVISRHNVLM